MKSNRPTKTNNEVNIELNKELPNQLKCLTLTQSDDHTYTYPVIVGSGEMGAGKSTTLEFLGSLEPEAIKIIITDQIDRGQFADFDIKISALRNGYYDESGRFPSLSDILYGTCQQPTVLQVLQAISKEFERRIALRGDSEDNSDQSREYPSEFLNLKPLYIAVDEGNSMPSALDDIPSEITGVKKYWTSFFSELHSKTRRAKARVFYFCHTTTAKSTGNVGSLQLFKQYPHLQLFKSPDGLPKEYREMFPEYDVANHRIAIINRAQDNTPFIFPKYERPKPSQNVPNDNTPTEDILFDMSLSQYRDAVKTSLECYKNRVNLGEPGCTESEPGCTENEPEGLNLATIPNLTGENLLPTRTGVVENRTESEPDSRILNLFSSDEIAEILSQSVFLTFPNISSAGSKDFEKFFGWVKDYPQEYVLMNDLLLDSGIPGTVGRDRFNTVVKDFPCSTGKVRLATPFSKSRVLFNDSVKQLIVKKQRDREEEKQRHYQETMEAEYKRQEADRLMQEQQLRQEEANKAQFDERLTRETEKSLAEKIGRNYADRILEVYSPDVDVPSKPSLEDRLTEAQQDKQVQQASELTYQEKRVSALENAAIASEVSAYQTLSQPIWTQLGLSFGQWLTVLKQKLWEHQSLNDELSSNPKSDRWKWAVIGLFSWLVLDTTGTLLSNPQAPMLIKENIERAIYGTPQALTLKEPVEKAVNMSIGIPIETCPSSLADMALANDAPMPNHDSQGRLVDQQGIDTVISWKWCGLGVKMW